MSNENLDDMDGERTLRKRVDGGSKDNLRSRNKFEGAGVKLFEFSRAIGDIFFLERGTVKAETLVKFEE